MNTLLTDRGWDGRHGDGPGFLFFLLTLALLGTAIYFVVRAIRRRRGWDGGHRPDSRGILDERFARGEIDRNEYEHRRAVLDGADVIPPAPATVAAPPPAPTPPTPGDAADPDASGPGSDGPGSEPTGGARES